MYAPFDWKVREAKANIFLEFKDLIHDARVTPEISQEQTHFLAIAFHVHCSDANTPGKDDVLSFPMPWFTSL